MASLTTIDAILKEIRDCILTQNEDRCKQILPYIHSFWKELHVRKDFFISPIVITVKKDQSVKIALNSKILKKAIHKNKYQMPKIDSLIQTISQALSTAPQVTAYFTTLDLQYAYSQLNLHNDTARHCNFNLVSGDMTGT